MLNVLYYYYYLFYKKILKDPEPHLATILALSFSESLLINGSADILSVNFFCKKIGKWPMIGVLIILLALNYIYYNKSKKAQTIIKEQPVFLNSHYLTVIIILSFFILTASWMFWGAPYSKSVLEQCMIIENNDSDP